MESIDWKSLRRFYSELWQDMPFKNEVVAQEFMDFAVAKMRYSVWHGVFGPVPGWTRSLTNEMVCTFIALRCLQRLTA